MAFKHKKKYGQNFLTDETEILNKIMDVSKVTENDEVIEIGPGEGALTELLLKHSKKVTCFEIDRDLEKILRRKFDNNPKFKLVMGDVLEADFNKENVGNNVKVVANIPYYITSPIINKLIDNRDRVDEMYLMVQKEVAERVCAKSGKERSILTLAVEYFGEANYLFTIPKEFFTPVPKVDSAFMSIVLRKDRKYENLCSEELFFRYVKAAFSNKRKNLSNNFTSLRFSKPEIAEVLGGVDIDPKRRAETLSIDEFITLTKKFEEFKENKK